MTSPVLAKSRKYLSSVFWMLLACAIAGSQLARAQEESLPASSATNGVALPSSEAAPTPPADLPDAPDAATPAPLTASSGSSTSDSSTVAADLAAWAAEPASSIAVTPGQLSRVPLNQCPFDTTRARECRVHWHQLIISSSLFNAFQNAGNLYTGYWYRWETTHGDWFDRWINSAAGWRWNVWSDQNPFMDQYVGHSMMGAITNYLWIQNDPKGMTLEFSNTPEYWRSRFRAFIFSTAYSFEWKLGPFGEAGIGHNGDHLVPQNGNRPWTNETGWVELVTTPGGGLLWTMAEDEMDKHVVRRIEEKPRRPVTLLLVSFLTPAKGTANILRFRPPWYRDDRQVKANSFFSEPPAPEEIAVASSTGTSEPAAADPPSDGSGAVEPVHTAAALPVWPHYGGVHEFGAWWGLSLMSGHIWGFAGDVKYMPIDVNYSYMFLQRPGWNFRYSPEMTALAMLDWPQKGQTNPQTLRARAYGSGVSPVGFRASFFPASRVQPYLSTNGGFVYYDQRVLSPQGSQFMYTIDFGCGLTFYRKQRQSFSIGYRYQHLSNADISLHNPGTDANTFYVAVSRFRTKGYR
jgi:hypothetical protein